MRPRTAATRAVATPVPSGPALLASGPAPESVSYDARPSSAAPASAAASLPTPQRSAFAAIASAFKSSAATSNDAAGVHAAVGQLDRCARRSP